LYIRARGNPASFFFFSSQIFTANILWNISPGKSLTGEPYVV
jgi:hypothetical protein